MIRFCDGEVGFAEYDLLSRRELMSYFLDGHLDEMVIVYDKSDIYIGMITYDSLRYSDSIDAAIYREYVVLDDDVWKNVRKFFRTKKRNFQKLPLLPILNTDCQLICFAYQDEDANREIRMLRELQETEGTLQFTDIFPMYQCVKLNEFNELAFLFAEYLKSQNIEVQVNGTLWKNFFVNGICLTPEYECMHIYAEGTWEKPQNWKENLLRSVSVEFECIDKIYEANIKENLVKNTIGNQDILLEYLRAEQEVILCGTDMKTQDAYDFLMGNGIEACCFVVNELDAGQLHRLFGKKILSLSEAISTYHNPVFIECESKNSAWGFGQVDYYDYIGYERNKKFFCLKDYVNNLSNGLINALNDWKVVLLGDIYICKYLYGYLVANGISVKGYLNVTRQDAGWTGMEIEAADLKGEIMCLLAAPDFYATNNIDVHVPFKLKNDLIVYLEKMQLLNYSDYYSYMTTYINMEQCRVNKYLNKQLMPKRIVIGSIEYGNGGVFFNGLLDGHPDILMVPYWLADKLFWMSLRLSVVETKDILSTFEEICKSEECTAICTSTKFNEKMKEMLECNNRFTSQEIFVMIYISYMYMQGINIEIAKGVIYWNPHYLSRKEKEECVKWLGAEQMHCDIINIVRNACMVRGVRVKLYISRGVVEKSAALRYAYTNGVYDFFDMEDETYKQSDRLIVKFEDLKCYPEKMLMKICTAWGIEWSDSLMHTTLNGEKKIYFNGEKEISDFDLSPVYNTYEKYFSEFDRLRIMIIWSIWQRKYEYPYVELTQFSKRDIQEMFLKKYNFENLAEVKGRLNLEFRVQLQYIIRDQLQKIRMIETLKSVE